MPPDARKNCPGAAGGGIPGGFEAHPNSSPARGRMQPPPCEPRKVPAMSENHPDGFTCAWCGVFRPWRDMDGFDGHLKFCDTCVRMMDEIELGTAEGIHQ